MKSLFLSTICLIIFYVPREVSAQAISADSVMAIALHYINEDVFTVDGEPITRQEYNESFYINDLADGRSFEGEKSGIYKFSIFGDDVPIWIMWQDSTGYKVYDQTLDVQMLGEILEFCKRNKYSPERSLQCIKGLYDVLYLMDISFVKFIE